MRKRTRTLTKLIFLSILVTLVLISIQLILTNLSYNRDYIEVTIQGKLQNYSWTYLKIDNETYYVSDWFWPNVYSPPMWVEDLVGKEVYVKFVCGCGRSMVVELKEVR